ncbi:hypothetical protein [Inquilinus sp. CAU 1745]|uniref:hypothetical protein n=1 Tax=Inquilinus sp. CAU 1745 TaxID=3140369 RepID=UPI00325C2955
MTDYARIRHRQFDRSIRKDFTVETIQGWELRKSVGDFVQKLRIIDRINGRYVEKIMTKSGEIIKEVTYPLRTKIGYGSDKPELKSPERD